MSSVQRWELEQWAVPQLGQLLPLNETELNQILSHTLSLTEVEGAEHLRGLVGDSDQALDFLAEFSKRRAGMDDTNTMMDKVGEDVKSGKDEPPMYAPPPGPPPSATRSAAAPQTNGTTKGQTAQPAPASAIPPTRTDLAHAAARHHTNPVIEAAKVRARDEQEMQQMLQNLQYQYRIYNSDIEPEHEVEYYCSCPIHQYQMAKYRRYPVQRMWCEAVMYPGEHYYNDNTLNGASLFTRNPYQYRVNSPYGYSGRPSYWYQPRPQASWHAKSIHQTINLNNALNKEAQASIDAKEPKHSIWDDEALNKAMENIALGDKKQPFANNEKRTESSKTAVDEKRALEQQLTPTSSAQTSTTTGERPKASKLSSFRKSLGIKSSEERAVAKVEKAVGKGDSLRQQILDEENGRWPDDMWRNIVANYQEKVGMTKMIADLRARKPIQYLHLLRAGYFEPIPVAWANQASNPLKFSIEAAAGWRGITPAWRGYEDTAEERLYWVLNHREGSVGMRMKPDQISELNMARERMAKAVEPPPLYFAADDVCHLQHTSEGYSKQVMPPPFRPYDRPETPNDDTMVLLDVSGSMDFDPVRPMYDQYMITGYAPSTQPKNKDVAKSIIRRFTDAMANHDHTSTGYDLTTFSSQAHYIGTVNHANLDQMWRKVRFGGGTRVMTGWQKVKELHFQKHSESATHHPVYGWQAGPETPMLRLLLLLDGEATDMDEFELDLLGLSWAHVTIFLIGVDGCPHHHRHANELQRISDVNHHVSFVDAQGNCPERYVTHELLKRHLGYDVTMQEFETMEQLPAYSEI